MNFLRGGTTSIRGIYYQVMISVERILTLLHDYAIDYIILEAVNKEAEDINIIYKDGIIIYEQVKTKRRGVWHFNDFFKDVFQNFLGLLENSDNPDLINFRFVSNAPPDSRLDLLLYDIKPIVTEENLISQLNNLGSKKILRKDNWELINKLLQEYGLSNFVKVLKQFEPFFSYFSSEDPNQPEKYIRIYLEQKICLDCGKTRSEAKNKLLELHHFAFKKSRYPQTDKRIITKKDVSAIVGPCISREEQWKQELEAYFPKSVANLIYEEMCLGNLYCPQFNVIIAEWEIILRVYSKTGTVFLFRRIGQSISITMENSIKLLKKYIARKLNNTKVIYVAESLGSDYPKDTFVVSSDEKSIKELKNFLRADKK